MAFLRKLIHKGYVVYICKRWNSSALLAHTFLEDYKERKIPLTKIFAVHRKGFAVSDWCCMNVAQGEEAAYMTSAQYYGLHPINGQYSHWIDDKLTLKYLCHGTDLDRYITKYYYQIDDTGRIWCLMDCPNKKHDAEPEEIAALLREEGALAVKLQAGAYGAGFYKAEYRQERYYLNGEELDLMQFCKKIAVLRNYIITEFLRPHPELAAYCPNTANCIRYLIGRINGKMILLKSFIRFGRACSGYVENYNAGGITCYIDENGNFTEGNSIDDTGTGNKIVHTHPDTGKALSGQIPMWEQIVEAAAAFDLHFPQMKYMGLDFVVTDDNRVLILEINSLTSLAAIERDGRFWDKPAGDFFRALLDK